MNDEQASEQEMTGDHLPWWTVVFDSFHCTE